MNYPEKYKLSSGIGKSKYELVAFDSALIHAQIANYNLLRVSSILPIGAKYEEELDKKEGSALLVAYATISSNVKGDVIASAVSVAIPKDKECVGVIMEYSGHCSKEVAEEIVRKMAEIAIQNHGIEVEEIKSSAMGAVVEDEDYVSVISAVALW